MTQQTALERVIAGKRDAVDKEIGWLQKAFKLACAAGYESVAEHPQILEDAIKTCSADHARAMGDGPYKPVDYDFYYPASEAALKREIVPLCKEARLPYEAQMKLDLVG